MGGGRNYEDPEIADSGDSGNSDKWMPNNPRSSNAWEKSFSRCYAPLPGVERFDRFAILPSVDLLGRLVLQSAVRTLRVIISNEVVDQVAQVTCPASTTSTSSFRREIVI